MFLSKSESRPYNFDISPYKRHLVTSWPISALWVFLSLSLAILSTFSFLQADWVVKQDLVVTTIFHQKETNQSMSALSQKQKEEFNDYASTNQILSRENQMSTFDDSRKYSSKYSNIEFENKTIFYDSHFNRIVKVTKVITTVRFGLIGVCTSKSSGIVQCFLYENSQHDVYPISDIWPMLTLVGGGGCVTLCICAVLSLLAVTLPSSQMRHQVATTIGHAQTVAVMLLILSLLGFPLGFTSDFVRHHCGPSARMYVAGDCEIGWAYALVLVSTSLSLYCPVLVKFTAELRYGLIPTYF